MSQSLFERIVAGALPSHRVYEDAHAFAFLDIGPVSRGHTLLIPKRCYVELDEVPPEVAAALGVALPKLVAAVKAATGCAGVNVLQNNGTAAGQAVMHVHFHLIPRYAEGSPEKERFRFDWPAGTLSDDDAAELVHKIQAALA
jgi:histidine triad (HIT) family protein